jgi:hypothetical protein
MTIFLSFLWLFGFSFFYGLSVYLWFAKLRDRSTFTCIIFLLITSIFFLTKSLEIPGETRLFSEQFSILNFLFECSLPYVFLLTIMYRFKTKLFRINSLFILLFLGIFLSFYIYSHNYFLPVTDLYLYVLATGVIVSFTSVFFPIYNNQKVSFFYFLSLCFFLLGSFLYTVSPDFYTVFLGFTCLFYYLDFRLYLNRSLNQKEVVEFISHYSKDGVILLDENERVIYSNKNARTYLNLSYITINGENLDKLIKFYLTQDKWLRNAIVDGKTIPDKQVKSYIISSFQLNRKDGLEGKIIIFRPNS